MNRIPLQSARRPARRRVGFTLIELLVAIAVLSLMMTLAARIFFDAQTGVQRGLQTSQIIAESRSISQPLTEDVRSMNVFSSKFESNTPGFLVIHQNTFGGVLFPPPDDINADPSSWTADRDGNGTRGQVGDLMRSDQIAFFRDANDLESLTPGEDSRYDSDAKARHARVWYGHVSPVQLAGNRSLNPGDPEYDLASQLVLGRQALLLIENSEATTYPGGRPGNNSNGDPQGRFADVPGRVDSATFTGLFDAIDLNTFNRFGATYSIYDDQGVDPATSTDPRGLFRSPTPSVATPPNFPSYYGSVTVADGLPGPLYADRVAEWLYLDNDRRLQAATSIETDFTLGGTGGIFEADTIAQLHAAFAPHVADFAIEFAADWSDDWDDTNPGMRVAGQDGQPDNEPDRDRLGNIVWYTAAVYANPDSASGLIDDTAPNYDSIGNVDPSAPVTYPIPTDVDDFRGTAGTIPNPFVYDLTNSPTFTYLPTSTSVTYVWSHTGDDNDLLTTSIDGAGKYWPYLVRFRYRLMDGKGEFRSIEANPLNGQDLTIVGRWFEQVVPVPRPQTLF